MSARGALVEDLMSGPLSLKAKWLHGRLFKAITWVLWNQEIVDKAKELHSLISDILVLMFGLSIENALFCDLNVEWSELVA